MVLLELSQILDSAIKAAVISPRLNSALSKNLLSFCFDFFLLLLLMTVHYGYELFFSVWICVNIFKLLFADSHNV